MPNLGHDEFLRLLTRLEDWYADSVKARAYDAGGTPPPAEHAVLRRNRYPGPDWRKLWDEAENDLTRAAILRSLEDELHGLSHGPSRVGPASGLYQGTKEWRCAVAKAEGSLRTVARRFGISHTEVRRLRLRGQEC